MKRLRFIVGFPPGASARPAGECRTSGVLLKKPEVIEKLLTNRDDLALWRRLVAQAGIALE